MAVRARLAEAAQTSSGTIVQLREEMRVLVEHDLQVLQSLDSCNSRTSGLSYDADSGSMDGKISDFSGDFGRVKSQFRERNTIFDGIARR